MGSQQQGCATCWLNSPQSVLGVKDIPTKKGLMLFYFSEEYVDFSLEISVVLLHFGSHL